jgi:hypothetical protein
MSVNHPKRTAGGGVATEHIIQLFDDSPSLAASLSTFLRDGLAAGDMMLVVTTAERWRLTSRCLARREVNVDRAMRTGRLTLRDPDSTLREISRNGWPDRDLFHRVAGSLLRELGSRGRRLRIYGDMVDLLAARGDFKAAEKLEDLWNTLGEQELFTLFCGYSSVNFGDPCSGDALERICRAHSHARSNPRDLLGTYLLKSHCSQPSVSISG